MTSKSNAMDTLSEWQKAVADYHNAASCQWEGTGVQHFHHGFYDLGLQNTKDLNHGAAQVRMIEEGLSFAAISDGPKPMTVLDVGCGIGGSSRYLAKKYGATVTGITLSVVEANKAIDLTAAEGLADKVKFIVADALDQPFPDGQFDLVWSIECAEHVPDKEQFMRELVRVTAPGGVIILLTFCHRDLLPGEVSLQPSEQKAVADYHNAASCQWEGSGVQHFHHGFYDLGLQNTKDLNHGAAQVRMIEEGLSFAAISDGPKPMTVLDVGCGIGGSSRYLAKKYGATVTGITLSVVEANKAIDLTAAEGLADKVKFEVADALDQPFPDGQFDLVWSIGCAEHVPDKGKFMRELVRVTAPGGVIILLTFCHRDLLPGEVSLQPSEQWLLDKICEPYLLSPWCSAADYVKIARALPLQDIKFADWSENVAPFWSHCKRSTLTWRGALRFMKFGWRGIKQMFAMHLMVKGATEGLIRFAVITARKPE